MLADVSKALGKSFFFGVFLPALFLVANAAGMVELAIDGSVLTGQIGLALVVPLCLAGTFLVATVFWGLNISVVRFYEGYRILRWQFLRRGFQSQRDKLYEEIATLRVKLETHPSQQGSHEDLLRLTDLQVKAEVQYPPCNAEVLPTMLGNIIRAFEYYPATRYGIETITVWPRLVAILPEKLVDAINTEKSLVDFWLNFSLALSISGLFWALAMWYAGIPLPFLIAVLIGGVLFGYLAYRAAMPSAIAWGYEVRTAFDLYREDLLRKLGLQRPASASEERSLWDRIFWFFTYEDYAKREGLPPSSSNQNKGKES